MNYKTILKSFKNKDMLKRILTVFGIVVAYRLLAHVPVPLAEPKQLQEVVSGAITGSDFGGFLNLLSGGALTSMSIILVGISPYITASIMTQLLTKAIPSIEELSKDGESGRRKINQWTRIISVPLAVFQSIAYIFILNQTVLAGSSTTIESIPLFRWVIAVTAMSAGSILLMWLGELITEQGIGNGISTIVAVGILSQLPQTIGVLFSGLFDSPNATLNVFNWFTLPVDPTMLALIGTLAITATIMIYLLVKINEAQRLIMINYAKRVHGNSAYGGIKSVLPMKLISAGVIPVIFAVAFLSLPAFAGQLMQSTKNPDLQVIAANLIKWFQTPTAAGFEQGWQSLIYPIAYLALIISFTYIYTSVVFSPNEIADGLQKQGGFISGVRPGTQTEKYLYNLSSRLTLFGSLSIGLIAVSPFVIDYLLYKLFGVQDLNLTITGTGALIIVTTALENLRQLSSRALMVTYDEYK